MKISGNAFQHDVHHRQSQVQNFTASSFPTYYSFIQQYLGVTITSEKRYFKIIKAKIPTIEMQSLNKIKLEESTNYVENKNNKQKKLIECIINKLNKINPNLRIHGTITSSDSQESIDIFDRYTKELEAESDRKANKNAEIIYKIFISRFNNSNEKDEQHHCNNLIWALKQLLANHFTPIEIQNNKSMEITKQIPIQENKKSKILTNSQRLRKSSGDNSPQTNRKLSPSDADHTSSSSSSSSLKLSDSSPRSISPGRNSQGRAELIKSFKDSDESIITQLSTEGLEYLYYFWIKELNSTEYLKTLVANNSKKLTSNDRKIFSNSKLLNDHKEKIVCTVLQYQVLKKFPDPLQCASVSEDINRCLENLTVIDKNNKAKYKYDDQLIENMSPEQLAIHNCNEFERVLKVLLKLMMPTRQEIDDHPALNLWNLLNNDVNIYNNNLFAELCERFIEKLISSSIIEGIATSGLYDLLLLLNTFNQIGFTVPMQGITCALSHLNKTKGNLNESDLLFVYKFESEHIVDMKISNKLKFSYQSELSKTTISEFVEVTVENIIRIDLKEKIYNSSKISLNVFKGDHADSNEVVKQVINPLKKFGFNVLYKF